VPGHVASLIGKLRASLANGFCNCSQAIETFLRLCKAEFGMACRRKDGEVSRS
jgi:hypothetical protein